MSIYAVSGATIEAVLHAQTTGQVGTYRISILDTPGGSYFLNPTASGITEKPTGSAVYGWTGNAPTAIGQYSIIWDDGTSSGVLAVEDLTITQSGTQPQVPSGTDLCTLADVRTALEMPTSDTARDAYIQALITVYSAAIMNEVNREFAPITGSVGTPTTRRFMVPVGQYRLDLDPYDLQTCSSIVVNPELAAPTTLTATDHYVMQPVTKADGVWTSVEFSRLVTSLYTSQTAVRYGYALVDVSGVWGFPSVPDAVRQACILSVTSAMRRDISAFGMDVEEAVQLATERSSNYGIPPAARRLLNSYRRHVVF